MPDEIIRATQRQRGTVLSPVSVSVTSRGFIKTSGWLMARIFLSICPALRCEEIWVLKIRALPSENFAKARRLSQRIVNRLDKGACDSLSNWSCPALSTARCRRTGPSATADTLVNHRKRRPSRNGEMSCKGPDLQNILRQSYDYLTIMLKLLSTYDGRLIYKKIWNAFMESIS